MHNLSRKYFIIYRPKALKFNDFKDCTFMGVGGGGGGGGGLRWREWKMELCELPCIIKFLKVCRPKSLKFNVIEIKP